MVDPATTPLGKMLLDEITPVVMVLRTPLVEESCGKNGISLLQMLSPFCNFSNIDVPVRTASDQPYRLHKFKLRLFYESDIRHPNLEVAKEQLKQVITRTGEKELSELGSDPPEISDVVGRSESEILPSWFQLFNKELMYTVSFSEHEAFDHPVACLLVVSSEDEQPINRFIDLFNTNKLPSLLNDGAMDPKILKHYLLVHDNQDGPSEKYSCLSCYPVVVHCAASKILTEMRSTFGPNDCQLLCINSSEDGRIERQDNPWASHKSDASPSKHLGSFLNNDDFSEIKDVMQELASKHIIPYMEQKIRVLNQQVSATRKGFRNQLKNLWWRKGKEETSDSPNGPMYTFSSIESQIRILGDYAFMLRDYELALSNYRLISTDYKLDKAWKRYAGVQEMMGLTYFMLDQSRKEAEYCMENAFTTYAKIGSSGQQNATRCGLWWVEMLKARHQYKDAATVYFRICGEINHAIRTYRSAVSVYKGSTWSHIKDHVHFHIGQWYAVLGMHDIAVAHMLEVLDCSHQSRTTQELFLRDFLQVVQVGFDPNRSQPDRVCKFQTDRVSIPTRSDPNPKFIGSGRKTGKTFEVVKPRLPIINISSLKVIFEDHRTYASAEAANVRESLWRSLEEDMIPSLSTARSNWLELQSKLIMKKFEESNICVAGEPVKVDIEFKNPLQIPISISNISLICELSTRSDEMESDSNSSTTELQNDEESKLLTTTGEMNSDTSSFTLSEVDISLGGTETILVQLMVTPKVEGILKIVGVRWRLSGSLVGVYNFESNLVKKKIAKGRRKVKSSPSNDLKFIVIKSLPKLEGLIHPLPERAYAGDLRHLVLELKNQSDFSVKNLKMKVSHPRFLSIGNRDDMTKEFPACLQKMTNAEQSVAGGNFNKMPQAVFSFPEGISIQGETPLLWPLWYRAAVPGKISLSITIYYEMGDVSSVIKYRLLRMHYNLEVLPSLNVSFQISPWSSRLQQYLVRMDVVNQTSSENFQIHQLSSVGHQWEISLLQPFDSIFPSESLFAGQALSCFFMLKNRGESSTSSDDTSSPSRLLGSDVSLQGTADTLFDISGSPLADFHAHERLLQRVSQDDTNTVDFIFISQPSKSDSDSGISDPQHLFSHHACHCSSGQTSEATSPRSAVPSGNQAGWHDVPVLTDIKVTSQLPLNQVKRSSLLESVSPFIWSGSSASSVRLQPMSTTDIAMKVCLFSPGTYDLSNYALNWKLLTISGQGNEGETRQSSGSCPGYPYFLTVLQAS
ncbi:tetratricopeptide repeat (TPR)-like superfamily protein [Citrus sinensis]|nr:tetratricopeptide repeat (TPR)-like superfamily protein [Citrus sinensis]